jgi:hypothetical protein
MQVIILHGKLIQEFPYLLVNFPTEESELQNKFSALERREQRENISILKIQSLLQRKRLF